MFYEKKNQKKATKVKYEQYTNCLPGTILKTFYGPLNLWFDMKL